MHKGSVRNPRYVCFLGPELGRRLLWGGSAALGVLGLAVLSGCRSIQPKPAEETASAQSMQADAEDRPAHARLGYRLDWRGHAASPTNAEVHLFLPLGDALVYHDTRNNLTILDNDTGRIRWSMSLGSPLTRFVGHARIGDRLVTASDTDAQLFDLRTGDLVDRMRLEAIANSGPVIMGPLAVFGSATGEAYAIRISGGFKQWGHMLGGPITARPTRVDAETVAFVSDVGDVIFIDAESGSAFGRRQKIFGGTRTNPVTDGRNVYIAGLDQSVWAFNAEDGRLRWRLRTETPITAQPRVWRDRVFVDLPRRGFTAINTVDGSVAWSNDTIRGEAIGARAGNLIVWDGSDAVVVDRQRGDVIERVPFGGFARVLTETFEDGSLFTVSNDGTIHKYSPSF